MAPKAKGTKPQPATSRNTSRLAEPKTIGEKLQAEYFASRPLQVLRETKGWDNFTQAEKQNWVYFQFLETETYLSWSPQQQKELLTLCEKNKIPYPLPKPKPLGTDRHGRKIEDYTIEEYSGYVEHRRELRHLRQDSYWFKSKVQYQKKHSKKRVRDTNHQESGATNEKEKKSPSKSASDSVEEKFLDKPITAEDFEEERLRRVKIAQMAGGRKLGKYEGDPAWDDVVPIPQDDGEKPLAAIAYTDEYAEAISYLRAVMASKEHSERVLDLTAHIITLNAAHYTVWLFRAATLFALNSSVTEELEWVNIIALQNQKNYQIWHHRQLLIDHLCPTIRMPEERLSIAKSELNFISQMLARDSKNYHVWSYRQYLVRKLSLFPSQSSNPSELQDTERLIHEDVRNNSAWSHRFFIVFCDTATSTKDSRTTEPDPKVPANILDREIQFAQVAIRLAPLNPSPWNYLRGVLRKGARSLATLEGFAAEFVTLDKEERVLSSHALDFLADCWAAEGAVDKADMALRLLGDKYDRIRKNYWDWRRESLVGVEGAAS